MQASPSITLGSRPIVLATRIGQIVLPLFFVALSIGERNPLYWLSFVILVMVWEIFMSRMVFASVNEQGLVYLRWKKWKQVDWAEMEYGGLAPIGFIQIKLIGRPMWRRFLLVRNLSNEDGGKSPVAVNLFTKVLQPPSGRTN
jgi:hypothetical protein